MTYDEDDLAAMDEALAEMMPVDKKVDLLLTPMIEAMLRMRMGKNSPEPPVWELKAEGAYVGATLKEIICEMDEQEVIDVLFCSLGRLAALSLRYAYLVSEGREDPA